MRSLAFASAACIVALLTATVAEARPSLGASAHRAGGDASARAGKTDSIIESLAALLGLTVTAKATPIAGSETPRGASPRTEQCEEEKRRADATKASESRRSAQAEKRSRGGDPVYLAF